MREPPRGRSTKVQAWQAGRPQQRVAQADRRGAGERVEGAAAEQEDDEIDQPLVAAQPKYPGA